jgi:hypothetical protein
MARGGKGKRKGLTDAQFNPAISVIEALEGKLAWSDAIAYAFHPNCGLLRWRAACTCDVRIAALATVRAHRYRAGAVARGICCDLWIAHGTGRDQSMMAEQQRD